MKKESDQETIDLIQSIESLMRCLSHRNLQSSKVKTALRHLKKGSGFKKIVGELSSVHVLNLGEEAPEGSQRFRQIADTDFQEYYHQTTGSPYQGPRNNLIVLNERFVLQIRKSGKWIDAQAQDLQEGV
jgi:hypothetical protein